VSDFETTSAPLINHALQQMLNEKGAQGWELTDVVDDVAQYRRPVGGGPVWEYATAPLVPAARQVILDQWVEMGYDLVLEVDRVGYFKRTRGEA
jgi:hypothetical protein